MNKKCFVTGAGGFIGFHTCQRLIEKGFEVIGLDNLNNYYDKNLKLDRINIINRLVKKTNSNWNFFEGDIEDNKILNEIFMKFQPDIVIHLAAQAGVRYSIENPRAYINSNILGFFNVIELCKVFGVENFLYASSSSVYGGNKNLPFLETDKVDRPVSLYAATKKSNEVIAHSYSHLYNIPTTGLRFFTVYGPWGRPDMAPMIFANAIVKRLPIKVFNYGEMKRDFTYIDDVVEGIIKCCTKPATHNKDIDLTIEKSNLKAPYRIFNLGNGNPIDLLYFINLLEKELGIKAIKEFVPMQPGDVKETSSDTTLLKKWINYSPDTNLEEGIRKFASWFLNYYKIK